VAGPFACAQDMLPTEPRRARSELPRFIEMIPNATPLTLRCFLQAKGS